jgi:UDP-N-acetylglucosamine 2-epimerase
VIFPAHPRTQEAVDAEDVAISDNVRVIEPVGYLDILQLERHARMILTDSGGIQKEAYFFGVPCVTLREETEWVETVEAGWNVLVGAEKERILEAVRDSKRAQARPELFGDGRAAERFVRLLEEMT